MVPAGAARRRRQVVVLGAPRGVAAVRRRTGSGRAAAAFLRLVMRRGLVRDLSAPQFVLQVAAALRQVSSPGHVLDRQTVTSAKTGRAVDLPSAGRESALPTRERVHLHGIAANQGYALNPGGLAHRLGGVIVCTRERRVGSLARVESLAEPGDI